MTHPEMLEEFRAGMFTVQKTKQNIVLHCHRPGNNNVCIKEDGGAVRPSHASCDTVSAFLGRGKQTAWAVWESFPELTDALSEVNHEQTDETESYMSIMQDSSFDV